MSSDIIESVKIPKNILRFLDEVVENTKGYDVYLGGGYLRDIYFNEMTYSYEKVPKDLNIFFVPDSSSKNIIPELHKVFVNYDKDLTNEEGGVSRIVDMFIPRIETPKVQFIVCKGNKSLEDLSGSFDCNINQIVYSVQDKKLYATEDFYHAHEHNVIEVLNISDKSLSHMKVLRMKNKFHGYKVKGDWDLSWLGDRDLSDKVKPNMQDYLAIRNNQEIVTPSVVVLGSDLNNHGYLEEGKPFEDNEYYHLDVDIIDDGAFIDLHENWQDENGSGFCVGVAPQHIEWREDLKLYVYDLEKHG